MWTPLLSADAIAARIRELGGQLSAAYAGEELVLLGLLQGGLFFLAELARAVALPVRIETLRPRSYFGGTASSGRVALEPAPALDIGGRHVVVVDDIYDSGRTLARVRDHLASLAPRSLEFACLLVKDAPRVRPFEVRYRLFEIPNVFVVGCGLDLDGLGRNLPGVWAWPDGASEQAARAQLLAQLRSPGEVH